MKFQQLTLKDIANTLGVSVSTASRALRGGYEISEETRQRVVEYAKTINFKVNPIAKSLKNRRSQSIGIIVPDLTADFFTQLISGVESDAYQKGYNLVISQSLGSVIKERKLIQFLTSGAIDGLIIGLCEQEQNHDLLLKLYQSGLPVIFVDRVPKLNQVHKITSNHLESAINAVNYLVNKQYTRIAYFGSESVDCVATDRFKGYLKALDSHHLPYDKGLVHLYKSDKVGLKTLQNICKRIMFYKADAILIDDDRLANEFMKAIKRTFRPQTRKIAVACFTNSVLTPLFEEKMMVVRQPAFEIGNKASQHLIELISAREMPESFHHIMLNADLSAD